MKNLKRDKVSIKKYQFNPQNQANTEKEEKNSIKLEDKWSQHLTIKLTVQSSDADAIS